MAINVDNIPTIARSTFARREPRLKDMPLFMGLSKKDLEEAIVHTHCNRKHHKKGSVITAEGKQCDSLFFVSEGWVRITTENDNHAYRMEETIQAPIIIEPDKLFGMTTLYHSTYIAHTTCEVLEITKDEVMRLIEQYLIVRLNLLNIICRRTQHLEHLPWTPYNDNAVDAITAFIKAHVHYPAGKKVLYIKMAQLAKELGYGRLEISKALNALAEAERIILKRGIIEIPALQLL